MAIPSFDFGDFEISLPPLPLWEPAPCPERWQELPNSGAASPILEAEAKADPGPPPYSPPLHPRCVDKPVEPKREQHVVQVSRTTSPCSPIPAITVWEADDHAELTSPSHTQLTNPGTNSYQISELQGSVPPSRAVSPVFTQQILPDVDSPLILDDETQLEGAQEQNTCIQCRRHGADMTFCNVCELVFCPRCWDLQATHRPQRHAPKSIPHEKTDYNMAQKVRIILTPNLTFEDRELLHKNDEDNAWFGIIRPEGELPRFVDYGRYATLMAAAKQERRNIIQSHGADWVPDRCCPGIASFVGHSGAGKSTIIKLVIELSTRENTAYPTPVVGAAGEDVPTSENVHLYLDPNTSTSSTPILFADCEGLDGGEREPVAEMVKRRKGHHRNDSFRDTVKATYSEREIMWAEAGSDRREREFAVTQLYPRILYTFSDVVVFVLKNPRVVEHVLERLVRWAEAALEMSSNQPILPHAIIVLNTSENHIDESLWDVETATRSLMSSLSKVVSQNASFVRAARFWRQNGRTIETVEQLMESYYSSIRVIRMPTIGRPNLIEAQTTKLYGAIRQACEKANSRKKELRMLLDSDELQPYLQYAFDHFAHTLTTPFDFVQASFMWSPIPLDFGGNIVKLAINIMELWQNKAAGSTIFEELSIMVASCLMLDAARSRVRGAADAIFPRYLGHIDAALKNFCDRHWPCEYVKSGKNGVGARCVNVFSGHGAKGHQSKDGKVLAAGDYFSRFSFASHLRQFQSNVYHTLCRLLERLHADSSTMLEERAAAKIHKETIMEHFVFHVAQGHAEALNSHTACFCCLFGYAEHALPCGHVICTACLRTYGSFDRDSNSIEIISCPMDGAQWPNRQSVVRLEPEMAGVRILTLDGGGIRGIGELETLKQLERNLGGGIRIQSLFDLIVGTSTGGLIALGLGARNWSVDTCIKQFENICLKAFTRRTGGNLPGFNWLVNNFNYSRYGTRGLKDALTMAFREEDYLFGGRRHHDIPSSDMKVAVTTSSTAGAAIILGNYNRLDGEDALPYHFQRAEKVSNELKTWEAARATSATPTYFKPLCHEPSKQVYVDGGIHYNNPIEVASHEMRLIWPELQAREPDILLSVGSGINGTSTSFIENKPGSPKLGFISPSKHLVKITTDCVANSLNAERTWERFMLARASLGRRSRYVRLNPELLGEPPKLDDISQMQFLRDCVYSKMADSLQLKRLANQLIATLFYWDPVRVGHDGTEILQARGNICCRLTPGSSAISALGKLMQEGQQNNHRPTIRIYEEGSSEVPQTLVLDTEIIEIMVRQNLFHMRNLVIELSHAAAKTNITLSMDGSRFHPISGFPQSLLRRPSRDTNNTRVATSNPNRWSRATSQRLRWTPPSKSECSLRDDSISAYADPTRHVLGSATLEILRRSASQLSTGRPLPEGAETGLAPVSPPLSLSLSRSSSAGTDYTTWRAQQRRQQQRVECVELPAEEVRRGESVFE